MSFYLTTTSIMGPTVPVWLEETCQRLTDNDPTLTILDLTGTHRLDDVLAHILAKAMRDNRTVTTIILSCYALVDDGAYVLGTVLAAHKQLNKVQLRDLQNSREAVTLFRALLHNTSIEELSLRHSTLCKQGATAMETVLRHHPRLQEVRFIDCQIVQQQETLGILLQGIQGNSSIKRLYLVNTELNAECAYEIVKMLQHPFCELSELYLCENDLGDDGVAILCQGVCNNSTLRVLDLRSNYITANSALSLQGVLVSCPDLVSLCLSNNNLGNVGVTALARGLQHSACQLQRLDLGENHITTVGASRIANMLRYNTSLLHLNLSLNSLHDEGASLIGEALVKNCTLQFLSMRRCMIGNAGAIAFAKELPNMYGLKELIMAKNHIDHAGALALLEGLRHNMEIEYLHIEDKISEPLGKEIIHWIRLNKAGRRFFRQLNVPSTLWASVYGRISSDYDALFHFLNQRPDIL